ncbi:sodium/calcium exchanger regulatory protein 1-like [Tubulanus polymorphus]|uniref:sodium/calcium exchanger regulatory protein 1-like n=1 Tax=Tubulanus polymorphus TaxID=672921 RepID=UPI003DA66602
MEKYEGKWKLEESNGFDEFMEALNVSAPLRKLASLSKPKQFIEQKDGGLYIKTTTSFKNTELFFKLGEEFEEKTGDGRTVKTTINLDDEGRLVQIQPGTPEVSITREIKDEKYVMTLVCGDVTCTRIYKRHEK